MTPPPPPPPPRSSSPSPPVEEKITNSDTPSVYSGANQNGREQVQEDYEHEVPFPAVRIQSKPQDPDGGEITKVDTQSRSKRLRFGTIRRKHRKTSGKSSRTASVRLRQFSQHVPGLSSIVHAPEEGQLGDNQAYTNVERTVYVNQPLPPHEIDPETGFPKVQYCRNKVRTTKYTPLTFIPLNLFYQFHNIANIYFLFIVILSAIKIFGVVSAALAAVPIIVIVIITAFKDAIEDYRRMVLDSELNNTVTRILYNYENANVVEDNVSRWRRFKKANTRFWGRIVTSVFNYFMRLFKIGDQQSSKREKEDPLELVRTTTQATSVRESIYSASTIPLTYEDKVALYEKDGSVIDSTKDPRGEAKFKKAFWKNVEFGSIVKVRNNEEFPADLVVLSTSDPDGACYIETRNLDGETNLKVRQSLRATSNIRSTGDLEQSVFKIESEAPHKGLYNYNGVLKWEQRQKKDDTSSPYVPRSEPISINNLLLRGCTLRNTKWVIGVAVYTGPDSKVMLNSGETPAKRSRIMRELNFNVICNFVFVVVLAFVAGVLNGVYFNKDNTSAHYFEFGMIGGNPPVTGLVTFWAAVILLQNLIPISLYISIEIIKTFQAFFIWNDTFMYYDVVDYRCTPKSWSISDDLGQVEYIFSDKTGTLTQNVMEFRKCTINGVPYGKAFTEAMVGMLKRKGQDGEQLAKQAYADITVDKRLMIDRLTDIYDNPELSLENVKFVSSELVNDLAGAKGETQSAAAHHFLLSLALCHSVLPERNADSGKLEFKAQSPDEEALVATASDMGFTLVERTRNGVVIDIQGRKQEFEVLCTLEFNSTRKRMSVIVRMPDTGKILLICKGADSMVYSRLDEGQEEMKTSTAEQLEQFANEGLRTLCLAEREISEEYYEDWARRNDEASSALQNREELMEAVADEIERNLTLIGGTAIEDRLQDGVPDSIALLGRAGIKLWVLTGDKVETAINIGYSCNLLSSDMQLLVLQLEEPTFEEADKLLSSYLDKYFGMTGSDEELKEAKRDHSPPTSKYAIVVDGDALATILDDRLRQKFVLLCKQCKSVLCCRVSPSQKAKVVALVKNTLDVMTLSIGDGANDVAMITEADVGCGIAGLEGRQAVMSSDYAFGQFRFLTRLLLVHGRWAYRRVAELTANLFYKNVVFTLTLFWYDCHNSFDGSYLFDYTYITLFNLAFTSLPVIFMGFLDQDVSDKVSMVVPELYRRGILRKEWTNVKFWVHMVDGCYQSAVCYFFSYCLFYSGGFITTVGNQNNFSSAYGMFTATSAIIACNLYVMMNQYRWDWLFLLIVAISILLVFFWSGIYTSFTSSTTFYKGAVAVYGSLPFWAYLLVAVIVCLLPRFACKAYQKMYRPRDVDIIREQIRMGKFDYLNDVDPSQLQEKAMQTAPLEVDPSEVEDQDDDWRRSVERLSTDRIRMSQDIGELTTAQGLLERARTNVSTHVPNPPPPHLSPQQLEYL